MKWIIELIRQVRSDLPGIVTVCDDEQGLLAVPGVAEALASADIDVHVWDGSTAMLVKLAASDAVGRPLLVVEPRSPKHLLPVFLPHHARAAMDLSAVATRLDRPTVRRIPWQRWDDVRALDERQNHDLAAKETALLVARALYGVDVLYMRGGSWWRTLLRHWLAAEPMPIEIARVVVQEAQFSTAYADVAVTALTDIAVAKATLARQAAADAAWLDSLPSGERAAMDRLLAVEAPIATAPKPSVDWLAKWPGGDAAPEQVVDFAIAYVPAVTFDQVAAEQRRAIDAAAQQWVVSDYNQFMSFENPAVLKLHSLVSQLDREVGDGRMLLVVLDAVGLAVWQVVAEVWQDAGAFARQELRAAFASLPTLTSVSRMAIFEGTMTTRVWDKADKAKAERDFWARRFDAVNASRSACFGVGDPSVFGRFEQGVPRLAVLDTSWDGRIHHLDPDFDLMADEARKWAKKVAAQFVPLIKSALQHGYRVFVTADHGHVAGKGAGRPKKGDLADSWSKRVLLFDAQATAQQFAHQGVVFQPVTAPPGVWPLFAGPGATFDQAGSATHGHGGLSLEELVVPVAELL